MLGVRRTWRHFIRARQFTVLAMESSADDTAVAIVDGTTKKILSNVVMKQHDDQNPYGGIHPFVAIQCHQRNLPFAIRRALQEAQMTVHDVDGIAFTRGPGMAGCLAVSVNAAKALAAALQKPIVGVNHMQAHALTPQLTNPGEVDGYPFLTLLISGGHTMIVLANSCKTFKILATSVDIAIGNAFDKAARMLDIVPDPKKGYGAALETFCREETPIEDVPTTRLQPFPPLSYKLPNPLQPELFSFAGLTAAVQRVVESGEMDRDQRLVVARSFQRAAISQLTLKLKGSLDWCNKNGVKPKALVASGGVASNMELRQSIRKFLDEQPDGPKSLVFPPPEFCTDNAAMIAWASMHRFENGDFDDYGVLSLPKWSIEDLEKPLP